MTAAPPDIPVTFADIQTAKAIAGEVEMTPALYSRTLSALAGRYLPEIRVQFTASFRSVAPSIS
jgi:hypothetical protein